MNRLIQIHRPILFAHRGASALAPENTLSSFDKALTDGAEAIELDVKLTADGKVIVLHDQTVNRTTNGQGDVRTLSLADVKRLDAGSHFSAEFAGETIPTLEEVFLAVGKKLFINVEITNYATPTDALPVRVAELVRKYELEDWVMFSSFNALNLIRLRAILPQIPIGILAEEGPAGRLARGFAGRLAAPKIVHPYFSDVDEVYVRRQHALGRRVHVWTVNSPQELCRLFRLQVDGMFTDDPHLASQILEHA
ncbi:MAG: glycerophosphodiester phosphodiesterase family protein [Anaerolineaceae bacterium]|nr:glycerophosphodiester phosphodiesterase family protein [Anaerolineaceae bacterium]